MTWLLGLLIGVYATEAAVRWYSRAASAGTPHLSILAVGDLAGAPWRRETAGGSAMTAAYSPPLAPLLPLIPLGRHLSLQGFCRFLDHLRNRNIALVRNGIDEIKRVPPESNVELMIPARKLPPALESLDSQDGLRGRNRRGFKC